MEAVENKNITDKIQQNESQSDSQEESQVVLRLKRKRNMLPIDYYIIDNYGSEGTAQDVQLKNIEDIKKKIKTNDVESLMKEFSQKLDIQQQAKNELKQDDNAKLFNSNSNGLFVLQKNQDINENKQINYILEKIQLSTQRKQDNTKLQLHKKQQEIAQENSSINRRKLLNIKRPHIVDIQINSENKQLELVNKSHQNEQDVQFKQNKQRKSESESDTSSKNSESQEYEEDYYVIKAKSDNDSDKIIDESENQQIEHINVQGMWLSQYQYFTRNGEEIQLYDERQTDEEDKDSQDSNRSSNPQNTYGDEEESEEERDDEDNYGNNSQRQDDNEDGNDDDNDNYEDSSDNSEQKKRISKEFERHFKERMKIIKEQQYHGNSQNDFQYENDF